MNTKLIQLTLLSLAFAAIAFFSTSVVNAADNAAKAPMPDGQWKIISIEYDGKPQTNGDLQAGDSLVISDGNYKFDAKAYKENGRVEVIRDESPAFITFTDTKQQRSEGIYKIDGDRLTLCYWAGARPKDFKSSKEAFLVVLERAKDK